MTKIFTFLTFSSLCLTVYSFSGEDRVFKKYALLKIYESCFGPEVTKIVRKEMKEASDECALANIPDPPPIITTTTTQPPPVQNAGTEPENNGLAPSAGFDTEKLHQAIFAYRPYAYPQSSFRPFPGGGLQGVYPAFGNQLSFQGAPSPFYSGFQQPAPFPPYNFPIVAQPFYGNRVSRDMAFHAQDDFPTRFGPKTRNISCLMQELGYLDDNLEPNYERIAERIKNLPISQDLRTDILDGLDFCKQFSQCVPEVNRKKSPLSRELMRPMFFFKCYKHKKLEACMMNDIRKKYTSEEELEEEIEFKRAGKSLRLAPFENNSNELAEEMAQLLYDDDSAVDLDAIL